MSTGAIAVSVQPDPNVFCWKLEIDDKAVPVSNSDDYAAALKKAGVEVEYVRVEHGPHGFGLQDFWTGKCVEWLRKMKF